MDSVWCKLKTWAGRMATHSPLTLSLSRRKWVLGWASRRHPLLLLGVEKLRRDTQAIGFVGSYTAIHQSLSDYRYCKLRISPWIRYDFEFLLLLGGRISKPKRIAFGLMRSNGKTTLIRVHSTTNTF